MELNNPAIVAEVSAAFDRYEDALVHNKVDVLNELFWNSPTTQRYGLSEILNSYDEIVGFRVARSPVGLARVRRNIRITTFGRDFAVANTEFIRPSTPDRLGRQSQTWVRQPEGWRIVSAHVSWMA
jgi:Protein of unknown function (DUF3225)